mmetsp:Transcript_89326/g.257625  ORF Transcript_89326/g.257625 Transcript_89326/m.257625 type:complete len:461 (+) Transcript_89326:1018-2400(+)
MQDRLQAQHQHEARGQEQGCLVLPVAHVFGDAQLPDLHEIPLSAVAEARFPVVDQPSAHAEGIHEDAASKCHYTSQLRGACVGFVGGDVREEGLRHNENTQREHEPCPSVEEGAEGDASPDHVRDHRHDWVADDARVPVVHEPLGGRREAAIGVNDKVLDVIIHTPLTIVRHARAPDEPVQKHGQQRGRVGAKALDDIGVTLEHGIHAVVVAVAVRANRQEVLDDRFGGFQATGLDGPHQRGDRLGPDLDVQHPQGTLPAWRARNGLAQLLAGVPIDRLHDDRGAFVNHAREDAGDQVQRPTEGGLRHVVIREAAQDLYASRDEGAEQVRRDAITDVAQAQRGNVLHHALGLAVHVQRHRDYLVGNKVEPGSGLLEVVLASGRHHEELRIYLAADEHQRVLVKAREQPREGGFLRSRLAHQGHQHARDILPQPRPRDLVQGAPVRDERPQGCQHHRLVLR